MHNGAALAAFSVKSFRGLLHGEWISSCQQVTEAVVTPLPSVKSTVPKVASKLLASAGKPQEVF